MTSLGHNELNDRHSYIAEFNKLDHMYFDADIICCFLAGGSTTDIPDLLLNTPEVTYSLYEKASLEFESKYQMFIKWIPETSGKTVGHFLEPQYINRCSYIDALHRYVISEEECTPEWFVFTPSIDNVLPFKVIRRNHRFDLDSANKS